MLSAQVTGVALVALTLVAPQGDALRAPKLATGYVATVEVKALAPSTTATRATAPEAAALVGKLRQSTQVSVQAFLSGPLSRVVILSTDFILPKGTLVLHEAGAKAYLIADPEAKTYIVMDAEALLSAIEGTAGVVNSEYEAKVSHERESREIAGQTCRKSVVTVSYASSMPFENDRIVVQQKNDIEVWHTNALESGTALDQLFFRFQRDRTGQVQRTLSQELGFPLEATLLVSPLKGTRGKEPQAGSFQMRVSEVRVDKKLDPQLFALPPAGFRRLDKNPYFKEAVAPAVQ
jgi:hypothetical protein